MQYSRKVVRGSNVLQVMTDVECGAAMQGKSVESGKHVVSSTLIQNSKDAQGRCGVQGSIAADIVCRGTAPEPGL